ncbi:hypothetical protein [Hymenobacter antarcticus]|uniref:Uncharacterized protein n=1 Tax=Hymenobacter antarcticus TaxID=486270 RepID=A0ABP7R0P7_9BACT
MGVVPGALCLPGQSRQAQEPREWAPAETEVEREELARQLLFCQDQLPPQQQAVFNLRYVQEMSGE